MLSAKEIGMVYETLLLSPGMNETVKLSLNISRKNVLLLSKAIEIGLGNEGKEDLILSLAGKEAIEELAAVSEEILNKAGLQEMNAKLSSLADEK